MKTSRSEIGYFILSLILVAVATGIYLVFGSQYTNPSTTMALTTSSTSEKDLEVKAEALLAEAQAHLSSENITKAQAAINKLSNETKKTDLQAQLDNLSTELANETSAQEAVTTAENEQTSANVTAAQAAIDALSNEELKSQLQGRLDAVAAALTANSTSTYSTYNYYSNNTSDEGAYGSAQ